MLHLSVLFASSMASPILLIITILTLNSFVISTLALKVNVGADTGLRLSKECSNRCESSFCNGEKPCDELDACCMKHDACISANNNNYLSETCNQGLLGCVERFKKAGSKSFKGNTCDIDDVTTTISAVMDAAILAGRYIHKP
ncbi:hypothetical protein R6Q59_016288 [Mikania micrantha]